MTARDCLYRGKAPEAILILTSDGQFQSFEDNSGRGLDQYGLLRACSRLLGTGHVLRFYLICRLCTMVIDKVVAVMYFPVA